MGAFHCLLISFTWSDSTQLYSDLDHLMFFVSLSSTSLDSQKYVVQTLLKSVSSVGPDFQPQRRK